jgi:UrcA family protein
MVPGAIVDRLKFSLNYRRPCMNNTDKRLRSMALALLLGTGALSGAVIAAEQLQEVSVQGSRIVRQVVAYSPTTGAPVESVSLTRPVQHSDLDLSTPKGAHELENRVASEAKSLCEELDKLFPLTPSDRTCLKKATDGGMGMAQKLIAAAGSAHAAAK